MKKLSFGACCLTGFLRQLRQLRALCGRGLARARLQGAALLKAVGLARKGRGKRRPFLPQMEALQPRLLPTIYNVQSATRLIDVSSTYNSGSQDWSANQALGEANTPDYGDYGTAWAAEEMNNGMQTITLGFDTPVVAAGFVIRESNGNGFVTKVEMRDSSNHSTYYTVWEGTDSSVASSVVDFTPTISAPTATVDAIRITVDTDHDDEAWEEIDAVQLLSTSSVGFENHAPTAGEGISAELEEDNTANITVMAGANDDDSDPLFLSLATAAAHGSVSIDNNGTPDDFSDDFMVYTPDAEYSGSDSFSYVLTDVHGGTVMGNVTITVDAVNDDPAVVEDHAFTEQNAATAVAINVMDNDYDAEGDSLASLTLATGPAHGSATVDGDHINYIPETDFWGQDELDYQVNDGHGGTSTGHVTINVYPTGLWASYVHDVSSEYGTDDDDWASSQALEGPNTWDYGDIGTAFALATANSMTTATDYIILGFATATAATGVMIRESNGNGFVKEIIFIDSEDNEHSIWSGTDPSLATSGVVDFYVSLTSATSYQVKWVKIIIDSNHDEGWEEIDAVRLLTGDFGEGGGDDPPEERAMFRGGGEGEGGGGSLSEPTASVTTRTSLGHGVSKQTGYDSTGLRLWEKTYLHGTFQQRADFSYDEEEGFLSAEVDTDALGRQTQITFDSAGRTLSKTLAYGTEGAATTSYEYDEAGNRTSLTDPDDNTTSWEYDEDGREILMTDPLGHSVSKTYDEHNRLASITDRNGLLRTFGYDDAGHLVEEVWYAGATTESAVVDTLSFAYNLQGKLISAENSVGSYEFTYNMAGQLSDVEEPFGVTLHFGYDAAGHRNVVEDSFGGRVDSTYNAKGQLTSRVFHQSGQPTLRIDFQYDGLGRIKKELRYNDAAGTQLVAKSDYTYDGAGRMTALIHKNAEQETLADYLWDYDDAGELLTQIDHGVEKDYTYDGQGQLTGDGTNEWSYDGNGNRNGEDDEVSEGNHLDSDGVWNYSYDLEGNVTKKVHFGDTEAWTYGYDNKNEMVSAVDWTMDPDVYGTAAIIKQVEFKYDVFGSRVEKRVDTDGDDAYDVTQRYALDGWNTEKGTPVGNENWDVWADLDGSSSLTTRYVRGDVVDQLFARVDGNGAFWLLADHLGSVRDVIDNSTTPTVMDSIAYDAFGKATPANETADATYGGRYKWTGREFDVETGLQYNRARYYDAATGRWMSQDPMGFDAGDSNLYRYVNNGPTEMTDPSGEVDLEALTVKAGQDDVGILNLTYKQLPPNQKDVGVVASFNTATMAKSLQNAAKKFGMNGDHFNWYQVVVSDTDPPYFKQDGVLKQCTPPYVDGPPNEGFFDSKGVGTHSARDNEPWYYNDGGYYPGSNWHVNNQSNKVKDTLKFRDVPDTGAKKATVDFECWLVVVDKGGKFVSWTNSGFAWTWTKDGATLDVMKAKWIKGNPPDKYLPTTLFDPLINKTK